MNNAMTMTTMDKADPIGLKLPCTGQAGAGLGVKTAFPDKRTQALDAPKDIQISNIQQLTNQKDMGSRKQHNEKRTQALPIHESENQ
jgi:hypothetical protein